MANETCAKCREQLERELARLADDGSPLVGDGPEGEGADSTPTEGGSMRRFINAAAFSAACAAAVALAGAYAFTLAAATTSAAGRQADEDAARLADENAAMRLELDALRRELSRRPVPAPAAPPPAHPDMIPAQGLPAAPQP